MKIVIAGGGHVGGALGSRLVGEGHTVTVIDKDRDVCARIFEQIGAVTILGDATDPAVLESAGIVSADIACALLARDADNLAVAMLVRSLSSARIMVRLLDNAYLEPYRLAGVRDVIPEADVVVAKMALAIEHPEIVGSLPLAGDAVLFEMPIGAHSQVAGKTVAEARSDPSFPPDCVFIGLVDRKGNVELPKGSTIVQGGSMAIMVARREELPRAIACLVSRPEAGGAGSSLMSALRDIDFLSPLSDGELVDVARGIALVRKTAGEPIFKRGDPGDTFYIVLAGEIAIRSATGELVETRRRGDFFGEISILTGEPRSADAFAVADSDLAEIGQDDFRGVVMGNPAIALEMSRILGRRLATAVKRESPPRRGLFKR